MDKHADKKFITAVEMLKIAATHAYCAEYLLQNDGMIQFEANHSEDTLLVVTTLMYQAFELTLKAFLINEHPHVRQHKNLHELVELNKEIGLSKEQIELINTLARQQAFRKGVKYTLLADRQQLHVFCEQIISLFSSLQSLVPVELQCDYQSA